MAVAGGELREAEILAERALAFARASGVHREEIRAQWALVNALRTGPTAVPTAIARCEELLAAAPDSLVGTVGVSGTLGVLRAMSGEIDEARRLIGQARGILVGIAHPQPLMVSASWAARIEVLAGDLAAAESVYRGGRDLARAIGASWQADALAIGLADVLCSQGRIDEAAQLLNDVAEPARAAILSSSPSWPAARARVHAAQGEFAEAERLAREAATALRATDLLDWQGDAELALAEVLRARGDSEGAAAALARALDAYARKGNIAAIARAQHLIAQRPAAR